MKKPRMVGEISTRNVRSDMARENNKIVTLSLTPDLRKTRILVMLENKPNVMMMGQTGANTFRHIANSCVKDRAVVFAVAKEAVVSNMFELFSPIILKC